MPRRRPTTAEERRAEAERRQQYRGPRQKPYKPRPKKKTKTAARAEMLRRQQERRSYVQFSTLTMKARAQRAAARAGLPLATWCREVIEDTLRLDDVES